MSSFVALLRSRASLRAACSKSTSVKLQLALQKWQLSSGCRAFSARASDEDGDGRSVLHRTCLPRHGSSNRFLCFGRGKNTSLAQGLLAHLGGRTALRCGWGCGCIFCSVALALALQAPVVGSNVAGIDQAALKEQQQLAARQLQQQQQAQEPATSPEAQQSALADAHEEVLGYGDEDHVAAIPGLETSSEASLSGKDEAMLADTANIAELDQPVSQLAAADPAEASSQPDPEPIVATPEPSWISGAAELSVDERIDVFLTAIRNRSWEETGRQPVVWAEGAMPKLEMPPSGYSEIAGTSAIKGQMLNPGRSFYPGQAYEPEVCNSCLGPSTALILPLDCTTLQADVVACMSRSSLLRHALLIPHLISKCCSHAALQHGPEYSQLRSRTHVSVTKCGLWQASTTITSNVHVDSCIFCFNPSCLTSLLMVVHS